MIGARKTLALAALALSLSSLGLVSGPNAEADEFDPHYYRVVGVAWDDVLYMRAGPSVHKRIVGAIPPDGTGVASLGRCVRNWCKMAYNGKHGWVNMRYLENYEP